MDIRKPKPIHSISEFLKEVGIIVLGVSIALAAEQGVERWRESRQYADNRRAVRTELGLATANVARRAEFVPCLERRLDDISALLDRAEAGQPIVAPNWIGRPESYIIRTAAEANLARSDLFLPDEQQIYGLEYAMLHSISQLQDQEKLAWSHLQQLEGRSHIPPEMINSMRAAVGEAHMTQDYIRRSLDWFRIFEKHYDVPQVGIGARFGALRPKVWPLCLPMSTPREEGQRLSFDFLEAR